MVYSSDSPVFSRRSHCFDTFMMLKLLLLQGWIVSWGGLPASLLLYSDSGSIMVSAMEMSGHKETSSQSEHLVCLLTFISHELYMKFFSGSLKCWIYVQGYAVGKIMCIRHVFIKVSRCLWNLETVVIEDDCS